MSNEEYFENLPQVGILYLEKVFVKFEDENILFICHDKRGEKYLCVCYEVRYVLKWVLCKVTCEAILKLLCGVMTVRDCFEKSEESLLLITYTEEDGEQSVRKNLDEVDSRILPDAAFRLKYDMSRDSYYVDICNELFKDSETMTSITKVDVGQISLYGGQCRNLAQYTSQKDYIVRKSISHPITDKNITNDVFDSCA